MLVGVAVSVSKPSPRPGPTDLLHDIVQCSPELALPFEKLETKPRTHQQTFMYILVRRLTLIVGPLVSRGFSAYEATNVSQYASLNKDERHTRDEIGGDDANLRTFTRSAITARGTYSDRGLGDSFTLAQGRGACRGLVRSGGTDVGRSGTSSGKGRASFGGVDAGLLGMTISIVEDDSEPVSSSSSALDCWHEAGAGTSSETQAGFTSPETVIFGDGAGDAGRDVKGEDGAVENAEDDVEEGAGELGLDGEGGGSGSAG